MVVMVMLTVMAQQQGEDGDGCVGDEREDGGELLDDGGDQQTPTE